MNTITKIKIRNGAVENPEVLSRAFAKLKDGYYMVQVKSRRNRSLQQNAYLHAVLPDIMQGLQDAGYQEINTVEKAKQVVKALFFKTQVTNGIETIDVIEDTSATSREDFTARIDQMIIWAKEYLGIDIAPPDSQTTLNI
jgi:hypothetical protein